MPSFHMDSMSRPVSARTEEPVVIVGIQMMGLHEPHEVHRVYGARKPTVGLKHSYPADTQEHQIWWRVVGTLAHWMLAGLSLLHFGCCHEPVYSPSYVGATACPLIPSNDRNALNG